MSKRYHAPLTTFPRVQAHSALSGSTKQALTAQFETLALLHDIREAQAWLVAQADATPPPKPTSLTGGLSGRVPKGCAMPGTRARSNQHPSENHPRREAAGALTRSQSDRRLHAWFDTDMARTGRELLSKRQFAQPQAYPNGLLRTGQRRLKIWRAAMASELGFGANHDATNLMPLGALRDVEAWRAGGIRIRPSPCHRRARTTKNI